MPLKDLERLKRELEHLAESLKVETRKSARLMIFRRAREIIGLIEKGIS
jgi:hypothetical protein